MTEDSIHPDEKSERFYRAMEISAAVSAELKSLEGRIPSELPCGCVVTFASGEHPPFITCSEHAVVPRGWYEDQQKQLNELRIRLETRVSIMGDIAQGVALGAAFGAFAAVVMVGIAVGYILITDVFGISN